MKRRTITRTSKDDVIRNIILAHNAYLSAFEKQTGVNVARWRLLSVMLLIGTCSQADLTARTTIGPAAVTRILKDFDREGLIKRAVSPNDARQMLVTLTEKGRRLVSRMAQSREEVLAQTFQGLAPAEIETLNGLLAKVATNLKAPVRRLADP